MRKEQEALETVTKICKESHVSKFNNMGHRRYEHRINSRQTKRSESEQVVRWLASAKEKSISVAESDAEMPGIGRNAVTSTVGT